MKFVDVKNDVAFRKIFGNEKKIEILISFLNAILQLKNREVIKTLKITNPYLFPRIAGEKASIIDVRAVDARGKQFIIEMQVAEVKGFDKRVQYYASKDYSMQIERGEDYLKLRPTIFIGILDFTYFEGEDFLSYHLILDEKTLENRLKDLKFCFIELPKFQKQAKDLTNLIDKWVFFIKNAESLEVIPDNTDDNGLLEAYKNADKHSWTKEELIQYDNASMREQDERGRTQLALEKQAKQIAITLIKRGGMTDEEIAELTNLTTEDIEELREQYS